MHPLERKTLLTIRREGLLQAGDRAVVGVSAGPDSMALLQVLASLRRELSLSLVAVYVDHGLRPAEAEQEGRLAAAQAARLGIPWHLGRVAVRPLARERGLSIEEAARLLRYQVLEEAAAAEQAARIALAHTADDQAEGILLRLIRGSGRAGLAGMKVMRDGRFIRPFLSCPKADLLAYLKEKKIPWLEDSSNRLQVHLRNRIRLDLLPYLAARYNPGIGRTLRQTAAILQDEEEVLARLAGEALGRAVAVDEAVPAGRSLELARLNREPRAIRRRVLETVLTELGHKPTFRQIEQLLQLAEGGRTGGRLHLARGLRAVVSEEQLRFWFPQGRDAGRGDLFPNRKESISLTIPGPGTYSLPSLGKRLVLERLAEVPPAASLAVLDGDLLDGDRLAFPLHLRSPLAGDRFRPLGAPGAKKIGDFLTDRKVPREKRWQVPVLLSEDEIVALLGVRIAHGVRITEKTRRAIKISLADEKIFTGQPNRGN